MKTFLLLLLGTMLAATAPEAATTTAESAKDSAADGAKRSAADLSKMQGNWMMSLMKFNGLKTPEEEVQALFRTVKDSTYNVSRYDREMVKGTFKLDASQSPKTIDSVLAGQDGKPIPGIYEFDGEKLRICAAPPGKPRPKDFEARLGSQHTLVVWEREEM
jgi:uncharacterized protein (TIGR03067 family)